MEDSQFARLVDEEMHQIGLDRGLKNIGDQFAVWFASEILAEDLNQVVESYHIGGSDDGKIDIGICDDDHDVRFIIEVKYSSSPTQTTFNENLIDEVLNARERIRVSPDSGSRKRREFAPSYNESDKPERLLAVGFGYFTPEAFRYANQKGVEIYDFQKIKTRYVSLIAPGTMIPPERLVFSVHAPVVREVTNAYEMLTFIGNAKEIASAVSTYGDSLFQENLRYRLVGTAKGAIGRKIVETVLTSPELLAVLNNGITIVANRLDSSPGFVAAYSPQVVNGGQTCWALYDAVNDLERAGVLSQVNPRILLRLIQTENPALVERITLGTNTQNPIKPRDMRSKEPHQLEIAHSFADNDPRILYEYKEGLLEFLQRSGESNLYRISGRKYRRLNNELAGQLYLAMLGLPQKSKAQKKQIMQDPDFYKTIFYWEQPSNIRFDNDKLGLRADSVSLRTGNVRYFVEDVLFGFGVYNLASAVGELYKEKLDLYSPQQQIETQAYSRLLNYEFMSGWEFYAVAAIHYVLERLKQSESQRLQLRDLLIGHDIDNFWRNLENSFNMNADLRSYVVLNESSPSGEYPTFGKWMTSIALLMSQQVVELKHNNQWKSTRHFLDLTDATFSSLVSGLEEVLGGPQVRRNQYFPIP